VRPEILFGCPDGEAANSFIGWSAVKIKLTIKKYSWKRPIYLHLEDVEASKNAEHGWNTVWETWIPKKRTGNSDFEEVIPHPLLTIAIAQLASISNVHFTTTRYPEKCSGATSSLQPAVKNKTVFSTKNCS